MHPSVGGIASIGNDLAADLPLIDICNGFAADIQYQDSSTIMTYSSIVFTTYRTSIE